MSKKKSATTEQDKPISLDDLKFTKEHVKVIQGITMSMRRLKMDQEALAEDIKGAAAKLNIKSGDVKEMANLIIQEEDKGGVIDAKEKKLDMIKQLFDLVDDFPSASDTDRSTEDKYKDSDDD